MSTPANDAPNFFDTLATLAKAAGQPKDSWTPPDVRRLSFDGGGVIGGTVEARPGREHLYMELCVDPETAEKIIELVRATRTKTEAYKEQMQSVEAA